MVEYTAALPISIHVPREGHDFYKQDYQDQHGISIHVPREGHDDVINDSVILVGVISIHVPREGHD